MWLIAAVPWHPAFGPALSRADFGRECWYSIAILYGSLLLDCQMFGLPSGWPRERPDMGKQKKITLEEARLIGESLYLDWTQVDIEQFRRGLMGSGRAVPRTGGSSPTIMVCSWLGRQSWPICSNFPTTSSGWPD